jgi:hypothetical protein
MITNVEEIIKTDIEQVQESFVRRSDVYNGKRVVITAQKWINKLLVCVKGLQAKEFPIDTDSRKVVEYILESIK